MYSVRKIPKTNKHGQYFFFKFNSNLPITFLNSSDEVFQKKM